VPFLFGQIKTVRDGKHVTDKESIMNLEEIKAWLAEHKEDDGVINFLKELSPAPELTPEAFKDYLDTQDGQRLIQPHVDRTVDKAIKTYRENHFAAEVKKEVAAEILKINPTETPEQRQIRELRETVEKSEKERAQDRLKRQIVEEASKIGVDAFFVDDYLPGSIDEGKVYLQKIKGYVDAQKTKVANELLASGGKPSGGNSQEPDYNAMSKEERMAHEIASAEKRLAG